jgi:hypothetical protein
MKNVAPHSRNSRPYFQKVHDRFVKFFWRGMKIGSLRPSVAAVRRRKNRRSRQDQLTIEILRYRVDHADAVLQRPAGQTAYSEAFKNFVLNRYQELCQELTPKQFAQAAGIPVELLNAWLEPAAHPTVEETPPARPAEKIPPHANAVLSEHFGKWLNVTLDFLNATGYALGWRAHQIKRVLAKVISVMIRALPKRLTYRHYDKIAELTPKAVLFTGYGAQALKQCYQKNLSRGLLISVALHYIALGVYSVIGDFTDSEPQMKIVRIMMYPEFENEIIEPPRTAGSSGTGTGGQGWAKYNKAALPPLGILTESNILLPVRVLPANSATIPPGPNTPDDLLATDIPMLDVAGLQELANQGVPSSIAGTGNKPLSNFIPKPGETPKIDLASVGGENGTLLPSTTMPGAYGRLLNVGATGGDGFNPTLQAGRAGYGSGSGPIDDGYSTGRPGSLLSGANSGGGTGRRPARLANDHKVKPTHIEEIILKGTGEKDWKSRDLKKLFHELLEWMEANRYEFPPALKHYMRFKNGDVTARVGILTADNDYELFMLCNKISEDFGLLLVAAGDSSQAICLRDTGFRKQSFYLSKGVAGRNEDRNVASVSMLEQRPTLQETSRFYGIFLSWWDKTKAGGQKKS